MKNRAPWPAVLIMSDTQAMDQASFLEVQPWTCFIGQAIPDAPACSSMDEAEIAQIETNSCNCSESYDQTIYDHFIANDTKKTISFMPPSYLVTGDVQTFFNLQVAFNCGFTWDSHGCHQTDGWNRQFVPVGIWGFLESCQPKRLAVGLRSSDPGTAGVRDWDCGSDLTERQRVHHHHPYTQLHETARLYASLRV